MTLVTDIRAVSASVIEQFAGRFDELPRPLLAGIGAGDLAAEQWAALRESVMDQFANGRSNGIDAAAFTTDLTIRAQQAVIEYAGKVQQAATELPRHAQTVADEAAESIQAFAAQIPAQAERWVAQLPEKIAELTGDVPVETVRDTLNAYAELVGLIYRSLADRGERTWSRVRSAPLRPGTVVDAASETPLPAPETPVRTTVAARSGAAPASDPAATTIKRGDGSTSTSEPRGPRIPTAAQAANRVGRTAQRRPDRSVTRRRP